MKLNETTKKVTGKVKETWSKIPAFWKGYAYGMGCLMVSAKILGHYNTKHSKGELYSEFDPESESYILNFKPESRFESGETIELYKQTALSLRDCLNECYPKDGEQQ